MPREVWLAFALLFVSIIASPFCENWSSEDFPDATPTRERNIGFVLVN